MIRHWAAAFRDFGPNLKNTDWYSAYLRKGEPTRTEQMRLTLRRIGVDDPQLAKTLSDFYAERRNSNLELFEEALDVITTLHKRYPLGLITNGPADIQRQEIDTLGIDQYCDHVYIEGEMGRGKPLPEVFAQIAEEVGKEPDQILFVGNSYGHDVAPALKAGWRGVWIRRPSDVPPSSDHKAASPEEMPEGAPTPDATIGDLREVLKLLGIEKPAESR